jgi:F0F1-type ATP synthase assembly protein I
MKKGKYKKIPKPKMRVHREEDTCVGCNDYIDNVEHEIKYFIVFIVGILIGIIIGFLYLDFKAGICYSV